MARQLRIHVPGGFYHVTLRGNHRQPIFFATSDRDRLNDIVAETVEKTGLRVHAYCWMTNHLHLLAQVSDMPLGRAILRIASRYARQAQLRLDTTGHLFERRYHCTLVDADRYLLTLVRYIHLNPVKAGLAHDPLGYPWSSHRNYAGLGGHDWVTTDLALNMLGRTRESAIAAYHELLGAPGLDEWDTGALALNPNFNDVLGDDEFAKRVARCRWRPRSRRTLDALIADCCRTFHVDEAGLSSRSRARTLSIARAWLAHEAVVEQVASVSAVARRLNRSEGALRQLLARYPRRSELEG